MIKKRLIGVVTVKSGYAVQSFSYKHYLPLGKVNCLIENLDRWGVDEIFIQCIDRSLTELGPDFTLLNQISSMGISTPLTYAGGIRNSNDAINVIKSGADRVCVDSLISKNKNVVWEIGRKIGAQALILAIPAKVVDRKLAWYDYHEKTYREIEEIDLQLNKHNFSEILLIDHSNEGILNSFNSDLVKFFPFKDVDLIAFGGISEPAQIIDLSKHENCVAIAIGNSLNYRELAIAGIRRKLPKQFRQHEFKFP
jgi:cyclase